MKDRQQTDKQEAGSQTDRWAERWGLRTDRVGKWEGRHKQERDRQAEEQTVKPMNRNAGLNRQGRLAVRRKTEKRETNRQAVIQTDKQRGGRDRQGMKAKRKMKNGQGESIERQEDRHSDRQMDRTV